MGQFESHTNDEDFISSKEKYRSNRASLWMNSQGQLLEQEWMPRCKALGLIPSGTNIVRYSDALMAKFFVGLGNIYRETDIDWDTLKPIYIRIIQDLLEHACKVKWLLSEPTGDVGWATVVEKICATSKTNVCIDHEAGVAFHDVCVPYVDQERKYIDGETRIRHVIYLYQSQSSLQELIGHFQQRMTGNLLQTQ